MQSILDELSTFWDPPPRPRRRLLRVLGVVGLSLVLVLGLGVGAVAQQTASFQDAHEGRILPGAVVGGVDVGGMTPAEAAAAVDAALADALDRPISLVWEDRTWTATPRELGTTTDADALVEQALAASAGARWEDLFGMRWRGLGLGFDETVAVSHDEGQARAWVDAVASYVNVEPRDAEIDYSSGWVRFTAHRNGHLVDTEATHERLMGALMRGRDEVRLVVRPVYPEVSDGDLRQVLLLRQRDHRLYLYEDGRIVRDWPVAIGASGYPTPTGQFTVSLKRYMPTWINPDPTGWGRGMPARIGPGYNNPLGVRALNWSVGAIRFHGTANVNSIGRNASKGCVRLTNNDVVELYDLVDEGAVIVSLR